MSTSIESAEFVQKAARGIFRLFFEGDNELAALIKQSVSNLDIQPEAILTAALKDYDTFGDQDRLVAVETLLEAIGPRALSTLQQLREFLRKMDEPQSE